MQITFKQIVFTGSVLSVSLVLSYVDFKSVPETTPDDLNQAENYLVKNNLPHPPKPFRHDGCTFWPDSLPGHDFAPVCLRHDIAYWAGGPHKLRERADLAFFRELAHTGPLGPFPISQIGYAITFTLGDSALMKRLNMAWGYGHSE